MPKPALRLHYASAVRIKNLITLQFNTFQSHLPSQSNTVETGFKGPFKRIEKQSYILNNNFASLNFAPELVFLQHWPCFVSHAFARAVNEG